MRIGLVGLGSEQLGISLLSAIAKSYGHEVFLSFSAGLFNDRYNLRITPLGRIFDDSDSVVQDVLNNNPDIVCFSPLTSTYQWMISVAQRLKSVNPDIKIVFGGVHSSAVPIKVIAKDCVDYVCVGEGDSVFPLILDELSNKENNIAIPNTYHKSIDGKIINPGGNIFTEDLNSLPMFDKPLWEEFINFNEMYFTMASRGCPFKCSYCFNSYFAKLYGDSPEKHIRYRSSDHVLYELSLAKRRYNPKFVEFEDDVFTVNKSWLIKLLSRYKTEINIPFQCLVHPTFIDDEIGKILSDAGCVYVQMGIQSLDEEYKRTVLKRNESNKKVENALKIFNKYKIKVKVDHMLALPGEQIIAQEKALNLYKEHKPYRVQTFWTNYFPGTELVHQALEKGDLTLEEVGAINDGLSGEFYRALGKPMRSKMLKTYLSYELAFKLTSILPEFLMRKLSAKAFTFLPAGIISFTIFVIDALSGIMSRNPDHIMYAKHIAVHLLRFVFKKAGLKPVKLSKIKEDIEFKIDLVGKGRLKREKTDENETLAQQGEYAKQN